LLVRRLVYVSCPDPRLSPDEIGRIATRARSNNPTRGITGVLLYTGRDFAQVIEGGPTEVESLFRTIASDPRHGDIAVVVDALDVRERWFAEWRMGYLYETRAVDAIARWRARSQPLNGPDLEHVKALFARADAL
jgi:hypothetical protein